MTLTQRILFGAASLLLVAQTAIAVPQPSTKLVRALLKRDNVNFEDCGEHDDPRLKKAGQAWSDAATLAAFTIDGKLDDGTIFEGTNA